MATSKKSKSTTKKSKSFQMLPWHRDNGLTEEGAVLAESALPLARALVQHLVDNGVEYPGRLALICVRESIYEYELTTMRWAPYDAKYVKDYFRKNKRPLTCGTPPAKAKTHD